MIFRLCYPMILFGAPASLPWYVRIAVLYMEKDGRKKAI
jgi:hypothetical protein